MRGFWNTEHVKAAEDRLLARTPDGALMRRAAFGVAGVALELLAGRRRVGLLVGAGNNGGDALWAGYFLRRRGVAVTAVLLNPDREWTLSELARRVDTHVSTALREVVRAEAAGVVSTRLVGRSRLARAAASPLTGPLTELLLRAFGPRQVVGEELEGVAGVEDAFLFGSWAARYSGEPGRAPADIDVLVLGQPDRDALFEAAERASERLAREVNVTIRGPDPGRRGARTRPSRHRHGQPINRDSRTSPAFGAPPSRLR